MVDELTRADLVDIVQQVSVVWWGSSTLTPTLIDINVLADQLGDALRTAFEKRECERRADLLRVRMLRLLADD